MSHKPGRETFIIFKVDPWADYFTYRRTFEHEHKI